MSSAFEDDRMLVETKLSEELGTRVTINSWIMSENTAENPDWYDKDTMLSFELIKLSLGIIGKMQKKDVRFSIADRSDEEIAPHYAIDIQFGDCDLIGVVSSQFFVEYISTVGNEEHSGDICVTASFDGTSEQHSVLTRGLFDGYCESLEVHYPEFDTVFKGSDSREYVKLKSLL